MPHQDSSSPTVEVVEDEKAPRPQRFVTSLVCRFRYEGGSHPCHVLDISEKGCFVESLVVPPPGVEVSITPSYLEAEKGSRFRISGIVKHTGRYLTPDRNMTGFGLEIRGADRQALQRLKKLIQESPGPPEIKFGMM